MKFRAAVKVSLGNLIVFILTCAFMDISFAQSNSNFDDILPNNISVSTGSYVFQGTSDDGVFKVMLELKQTNVNKEKIFELSFIDSNSGVRIENISYDIMLFKDDQHITESHRPAQTAKQQKFVFPDQGSYTLRIEKINNTGAAIDIPLQVLPNSLLAYFD
jgi:hypothetical protein